MPVHRRKMHLRNPRRLNQVVLSAATEDTPCIASLSKKLLGDQKIRGGTVSHHVCNTKTQVLALVHPILDPYHAFLCAVHTARFVSDPQTRDHATLDPPRLVFLHLYLTDGGGITTPERGISEFIIYGCLWPRIVSVTPRKQRARGLVQRDARSAYIN